MKLLFIGGQQIIILLLVGLLPLYLIPKLLGSKRKIGFGWSLFWCILLSWPIGLIITLISPKK